MSIPPVKTNMAPWDRVLRIGAALALVLFWYFGYIPADLAIPLLVIAGALTVNAMMGVCGFYSLLGISTCPVPGKNKKNKEHA